MSVMSCDKTQPWTSAPVSPSVASMACERDNDDGKRSGRARATGPTWK